MASGYLERRCQRCGHVELEPVADVWIAYQRAHTIEHRCDDGGFGLLPVVGGKEDRSDDAA